MWTVQVYKRPEGKPQEVHLYSNGHAIVWLKDDAPCGDTYGNAEKVTCAIGPLWRQWPMTVRVVSTAGCVGCGTILASDDMGPEMHIRGCMQEEGWVCPKDLGPWRLCHCPVMTKLESGHVGEVRHFKTCELGWGPRAEPAVRGNQEKLVCFGYLPSSPEPAKLVLE